MDQGRTVLVELLAEIAHVGLADVGVAVEVVVPDVVEDLRLGDHPRRVFHEEAQHLELGRGEIDVVPGPTHRVGIDVEFDVGEPQHVVTVGDPAAAPQDRLHPHHEFGQRERLGQIVVGPGGEPGRLVVEAVAGREETAPAYRFLRCGAETRC